MTDNSGKAELLALARELLSQHTREATDKATDIYLSLIGQGYDDPYIVALTAELLVVGPRWAEPGVHEKAAALAERAVRLAPDDPKVLEMAIIVYDETYHDAPEKKDEMIRLCQKVLKLNPDNAGCMQIIACEYRKHPLVNMSLEGAIEMMERASNVVLEKKTGLLVEKEWVTYHLAKLYVEAKQYEQAIKTFKRVLQLAPSDERLANNVGEQLEEIARLKNKERRLRAKAQQKALDGKGKAAPQ